MTETDNNIIESRLGAIDARIESLTTAQGAMNDKVSVLSGKVDKLQSAEDVRVALTQQAEKFQQERQTTLRWTIGMAFVGAGLVSGIVFGTINAVVMLSQ